MVEPNSAFYMDTKSEHTYRFASRDIDRSDFVPKPSCTFIVAGGVANDSLLGSTERGYLSPDGGLEKVAFVRGSGDQTISNGMTWSGNVSYSPQLQCMTLPHTT